MCLKSVEFKSMKAWCTFGQFTQAVVLLEAYTTAYWFSAIKLCE